MFIFIDSKEEAENNAPQTSQPAICLTSNDSVQSNKDINHEDSEKITSACSDVKEKSCSIEIRRCDRSAGYR